MLWLHFSDKSNHLILADLFMINYFSGCLENCLKYANMVVQLIYGFERQASLHRVFVSFRSLTLLDQIARRGGKEKELELEFMPHEEVMRFLFRAQLCGKQYSEGATIQQR